MLYLAKGGNRREYDLTFQGNLLQKLSVASFSFYMIHQLAINVLLGTFDKLQIHFPYIVELIVCLSIIMFTALIVNKHFEKPIADYLSRKIYERISL